MPIAVQVSARTVSGQVSETTSVAATTLPAQTPPSAPADLTIASATGGELTLTWSEPHDSGGASELAYSVHMEQGVCDEPVFASTSAAHLSLGQSQLSYGGQGVVRYPVCSAHSCACGNLTVWYWQAPPLGTWHPVAYATAPALGDTSAFGESTVTLSPRVTGVSWVRILVPACTAAHVRQVEVFTSSAANAALHRAVAVSSQAEGSDPSAVTAGACWAPDDVGCPSSGASWTPLADGCAGHTGSVNDEHEWLAVSIEDQPVGSELQAMTVKWWSPGSVSVPAFDFVVQVMYESTPRAAVLSHGKGSVLLTSPPASAMSAGGWKAEGAAGWTVGTSAPIQLDTVPTAAGRQWGASLELWIRVMGVHSTSSERGTEIAAYRGYQMAVAVLPPSASEPLVVGIRVSRTRDDTTFAVAEAGDIRLGKWTHVVITNITDAAAGNGALYFDATLKAAWTTATPSEADTLRWQHAGSFADQDVWMLMATSALSYTTPDAHLAVMVASATPRANDLTEADIGELFTSGAEEVYASSGLVAGGNPVAYYAPSTACFANSSVALTTQTAFQDAGLVTSMTLLITPGSSVQCDAFHELHISASLVEKDPADTSFADVASTATVRLDCSGTAHATSASSSEQPADGQTVVVALVPPLLVQAGSTVRVAVVRSGTMVSTAGGVTTTAAAAVAPLCIHAYVMHGVDPGALFGSVGWDRSFYSDAIDASTTVAGSTEWTASTGVVTGSCGVASGSDTASESPSSSGYVIGGGGSGFRAAAGTLRRGGYATVTVPASQLAVSSPAFRVTVDMAFVGEWADDDRVKVTVGGEPRALFRPPTTAPGSWSCAAGYSNVYGSFCYKTVLQSLSYEDAVQSCTADGADLLSFAHAAELDAVVALWTSDSAGLASDDALRTDMFTGYNDAVQEGTYAWQGGSKYSSFIPWDTPSPTQGATVDCTRLNRNSKTMFPVTCASTFASMCKMPATGSSCRPMADDYPITSAQLPYPNFRSFVVDVPAWQISFGSDLAVRVDVTGASTLLADSGSLAIDRVSVVALAPPTVSAWRRKAPSDLITTSFPGISVGGLMHSTQYCVSVASRYSGGVGQWTSLLQLATTKPTKPTVPLNFYADETATTGGMVTLHWELPADLGGTELQTYRLWYAETGAPETILEVPSTALLLGDGTQSELVAPTAVVGGYIAPATIEARVGGLSADTSYVLLLWMPTLVVFAWP